MQKASSGACFCCARGSALQLRLRAPRFSVAAMGCHGQGGAQTSRSSESSQEATREHRAAQEQPRSTRRSPGEPRSSHSNDTKMLRISALVFAVSVTETCFFSLGPYRTRNGVDQTLRQKKIWWGIRLENCFWVLLGLLAFAPLHGSILSLSEGDEVLRVRSTQCLLME